MSGYVMGRALAWVVGGLIEYQGGFDFAKYIGVVGLSRLLSSAVCVAHALS